MQDGINADNLSARFLACKTINTPGRHNVIQSTYNVTHQLSVGCTSKSADVKIRRVSLVPSPDLV